MARSMGTRDELALIGQIYEAALDPLAMQRLPLLLARHFDSESCILLFNIRPDPTNGSQMPATARLPIGTANFDPRICLAYAEHYHELDVWYERGWKKGFPAVVLGDELLSHEELMRSEFSDFCKLTGGMYKVMGAQYLINDTLIGALGIHRRLAEGSLDESDRRKLMRLLPHLQRTFQIQERLGIDAARASLAANLLESSSIGLIMVGHDSRLLFASAVAERLLRNTRYLAQCQGRLRAAHPAHRAKLDRLVAGAIRTSAGLAGDSGGTMHLAGNIGSSLSLLVAPLRSSSMEFGLVQPAAVLIFADPDATIQIPEQEIARAFGLTPAEIRLFSALLNGDRLAAYAQSKGISYGTARIHLKHLLQKTGSHSQADLVRIALKSPIWKFASSI